MLTTRAVPKLVLVAAVVAAFPLVSALAQRGVQQAAPSDPAAADSGPLSLAWQPSGPGVFTLRLDADPRSLARAFLSYRVDGLADGAAAVRSLNGLPPLGGFAAGAVESGRVVEEIDPRWLRRGDNVLRFSPATGAAPPAVLTDLRWLLSTGLRLGGAAPYEVRELELLTEAAGDRPGADPAARRIVVSLLRGDDGGAYLRGFLSPHAADGVAPELFVDGVHAAGALAAGDGGFELFVPRQAPGEEAQRLEVEAVYADGGRVTRRLLAGRLRGSPRGGSGGDDAAAVRELRVAPGAESTLELAGVSLSVGSQAVAQAVTLSLSPLARHQVPAMDLGMYNVTAPHAGFRFGPHGMRFARPVRLEIPFDPELLPAGTGAEDVRTFYFDEASGRWVVLPRLAVDAAAGRVASATDHFTDFVNAVLVTPDEPAAPGFAPNSLSLLDTADPASGLTLIAPPAATSGGDAELAFPLVVPPGRRGMEPALAVTYSSGGGNGWLGLGWDLALPSIEVSTLFGVPRYRSDRESETYVLDGSFLAPVDGGTAAPRRAGREFAQRVEGAFARIVRHGAAPDEHWWQVTGKDGVTHDFGRTAGARLAAPKGGEIFRWYLESVTDRNGNRVDYEYRTDAGSDGEPWVQLYPRRIRYTAGPGLEPFYEVRFLLDDEVAGAPARRDRLSTGLPGFKVYTKRRLARVEVAAGGSVVRAYDLVYREGAFAKTLLAEIVARGEGGEVEFFRHRFDYVPLAYHAPDVVDGFSEPLDWGRLGALGDQSGHLEASGGFHAFAGLGPPTCVGGHAGVQGGFSIGGDALLLGMLDVDGDGLPDRLRFDGQAELNSLEGFGRTLSLDGADLLGSTRNWSFDFGLGAHSPLEVGQLGVSWVWTHANDDHAVADVDGDLRADLVSTAGGFSWRRNTGAGFDPPRTGSGFSLAGLVLEADGQEEELKAAFYPTDTLLRLRLPYAGEVVVTGVVAKRAAGGDGVTVDVHHNSVRRWRREIAAGDLAACTPENGGGCGDGLTLAVAAGDRLYFRASAVDDVEHDAVAWAPVVTYTRVDAEAIPASRHGEREPWGAPVFVFDHGADLRLAGPPGGGWTATAGGRVAVLGTVEKQPTADDLVLRVERNGSEIYRETFAAARQGSFAPAIPLLAVDAEDVLTFFLDSASQVDPARVAWRPTVTYEGGEYCRQPFGGGAPACGAVSCDDGEPAVCTLAGDPTPDLVLRREEIRRRAGVETAVVDQRTLSGPTRANPAPASGPADLALGWTRTPFYTGPATLLVQGEHRLIARCVVPPGVPTGACGAEDVSLAAGEPVYFTVVAPAGATLASGATIDGAAATVNRRAPAADPDGLAGGYHGWSYGEWNGTVGFSEIEFLPPRVEQRRQNDEPPVWAQASPAPDGTDDHPGPAWVGSGHGFHLAAAEAKPARFGASVGPQLRGANGGGDGGGAAPTLLRKTTGRTASFSASLFAGASLSLGHADTQLDLLDMNADGYVDQVSEGKVSFSDGDAGFGPAEAIGGLAGAVRHVEDANLMLGVTVGVPYSAKTGSALSRTARSTAPSVGQTTTLSQVRSDLVDVNGDGLPDRVELEPDDGGGALTMSVRLNLGYRFGEAEQWALERWSEGTGSRCNEGLGFVSEEVLGAIKGVDDPDALSLTTTAAYDAGVAIGWFGGGANTSLSRTVVQLADVNGDGLADHVAKDDGEEFFRVKLNLGDRWGAEERWRAPEWTTSLGDGYDPGISVGGADVFNCFDAVSLYGHLGAMVSLGAPVCIPLVPPTPVVGLYLEFAGQLAGGGGGVQLDLADVDGDGLVDHVLKKLGDGTVHVRRNQVGRTNLLATVHRPLGGRIDLTYRRQGNRVETLADAGGTRPVDLPFSRWVLAAATVDDGRGNAYETAYDYFNDGYYDRGERLFYGFRRVAATLPDGSRVDTFFHNDDFHLRGLPFRETVADAAGNLYRVDEWRYEKREVRGELSAAAVFPALVEETTFLYDGTTPSAGGFGKQTRRVHDYDAAGNLVVSRDFADHGAEDDVVVTVGHLYDAASHHTLPREVEVRDDAGRLLRHQRMAYDGHGNLTALEATLDGGNDPESGAPYADATATWSWSHDARGMQVSAIDPVGYAVATSYDAATGSYPVASEDSFGYTTSAAWDLAHGVVLETTDANGESVRHDYDAFGRPVRVFGPYDETGSPLVAYEYAPAATPPSAVARHKDVARGERIATVAFVDGLGRTLQVKRDTEIDRGAGTSGRLGFQVEGSVAFDAKGRVAALGQPFFDAGPENAFVARPLVRPTRYAYDAVDRPTAVTYPHGATTRIAYGFAPLDGVGRIATDRFDANGRRTRSYLHVDGSLLGVEQTRQGRPVVTRYDYNPLSELTAVVDAAGNRTTLAYDTLGRRVVVDQPDRGRIELRWDRGGNLGAEVTARLAARGEAIRYRRTFHRLDAIDYPDKTDAVFTWGAPGAPHHRAGRLARVEDESGVEESFYGRRGEVVKTVKTAASLNGFSPKGPYEIAYEYDSFDRLLAIVYPDGERLDYGFDAGGRVRSAEGTLRGVRYVYLAHLGYDEHGQPVRKVLGNGAETKIAYDAESRFPARYLTRSGGRELQDLAFHHDAVGTLLAVDNQVPVPRPNEMGGPFSQRFTYDDLYQLTAATGSHRSAPDKTSRYAVDLAYDEVGNLTAKRQRHERLTPGGGKPLVQKKTSYDWTLAYDGARPHAPTQVGERAFSYDADGNQLGWDHDANGTRREIEWDESGRLAALADNGRTTSYLYDADGLRTNKAGPDGETIYVNRYFSVRNGAIASKHVFADDHRLATKLGQPSLHGSPGGGGGNGAGGNGGGKGQGGKGKAGGRPIEDKLYFFHGDHVGSTHFVTDSDGEVYQHLVYFPHGEPWVDERAESERTPYLFAAQELDEESGLAAIGVRYYDPRQGQWLSPDPSYEGMLEPGAFAFADPSLAPFRLPGHMYAYAANSPSNLVDANGLDWWTRTQYHAHNLYRAGIESVRYRRLVSPLEARALELHDLLAYNADGTQDFTAYDNRTTAIAATREGTYYVAQSGETATRLDPRIRSALWDGIEVDARGRGHAEPTAIRQAIASSDNPTAVAASRDVCRDCQSWLRRYHPDIDVRSPREGDTWRPDRWGRERTAAGGSSWRSHERVTDGPASRTRAQAWTREGRLRSRSPARRPARGASPARR